MPAFPITWRYSFNLGLGNSGLSPGFALYAYADNGTAATQPTIHEFIGPGAGMGWYYFDRTYISLADRDINYVVDGTPLVSPIDITKAAQGQASVNDINLESPYVQFTSSGDTVNPIISTVTAPTRTQVIVTYSKPVQMSTASNGALLLSNYTIPGLTLNSVVQLSDSQVRLTTSSQTPGVTYNLTVVGVEDLSGNPIVQG